MFGLAISSFAQESPKDLKTRLDEEFRWLQEEAMVVTVATKTKMNMDEAPSIVSVITEDQIKNSGAKSLEQVLRQVSGFYLYEKTSFKDSVAVVRGLSNNGNASTKIMINGHSTENPTNQNFGWVISFPVDLIKKIEIVRGPGSALYGTAAMDSVINIITKDAKDPSAVSAGYGSYGTYNETGQLSYSKNDFSLFLFADDMRSDGDPQLIEKDYASLNFPPRFSLAPGYTNEEFRYDTLFAKLSYKNAWLVGFSKDTKTYPPIGIQNALTDENDISSKTGFVEAGYDGLLIGKIRLSAKAYYDYNMLKATYEGFDQKTTALLGFPPGEGLLVKPESKSAKFGSEIMMNTRLANSVDITAGVLFEHMKGYDIGESVNINMIGKPIVLNGVTYMPMQYLGGMTDVSDSYNYLDEDKTKRSIYAGYIQSTWTISDAFHSLEWIGKNLTFTAGLRYDNYDDVGDTLNPRLGIVYTPNDTLFFKLLYGEAFRAPGFEELYYKNNPSLIGNPNLKPETVKTAELMMGVNLAKNITATLDFFNIRKDNAITLYQNTYTNLDEIESQGVEGELRVSFDKNRYGYFNITFQKAKDVTHETLNDLSGSVYVQDDFDLGSYPKVIANLGINSDISRYVNANVSVSYFDSMERIGKMQFTASQTDPDGTLEKTDKRDSVDGYALTNISLIFHNFGFAKGWEFQITGYNIFNADQRDPDISRQVPDDLPRWGRYFMGKITYTF
jgi:iron complex outermembrane receptor protein